MKRPIYVDAEASSYSNPLFFRVLAYLFYAQHKKETTLINTCQYVYSVKAHKDITHSSEYVTTRNVMLSLVQLKLVSKVKGKAKEYKSHYVVNNLAFVEFFLKYISTLPYYRFRGLTGWYGKSGAYDGKNHILIDLKNYSKNNYVQSFVLLYFRGISYKYFELLRDKNPESREILQERTNKEVILKFLKFMGEHPLMLKLYKNLFPEKDDDIEARESLIDKDIYNSDDDYINELNMKEFKKIEQEDANKTPLDKFKDFIYFIHLLSTDFRIETHDSIALDKVLDATANLFGFDAWSHTNLQDLADTPEKIFKTYYTEYD